GFDEQRLKNAFIESGAAKDLFNRERALRHVGGVLEQADIARHQRRRGESENLPERKIPGHDGEDWSERFVMDVATPGGGQRGLVLQKSLGIFGVEAAPPRAFFTFLESRAEQFSHFERDRAREIFLLLLEQRCRRHQQQRALRKRFATMVVKRALSLLESFFDFQFGECRKLLEPFAGGGIDRCDGHPKM